MRISVLASFFLLFTAVSAGAEPTTMPLHDAKRPVPAIVFADETGNRLTLEDWRDKVILLNIWATWCPPCRHEMPTLDRLQGKLGGENFEVLALSIDRAGPKVVRAFFDKIEVKHLRLLIDETGASARNLGAYGLPVTLLIDPDGAELSRIIGPAEWDTPEMIAFFEKIISAMSDHLKTDNPSSDDKG